MKTRNILFALMVILTASLTGCKKDNTVPNFIISGTVWSVNHGTFENPSYSPLSDITIRIEDTITNTITNTYTDVNGEYICVVPEHWSGRIRAIADGIVFKGNDWWYYTDVTFNHTQQDYWQILPR